MFPSTYDDIQAHAALRLSIPPSAQRHFSSLARRLGRIFAHAYYHHREAFEQAEAESSLYERFLALTSKFELVPPEFLVIPPRMQAIHDERERARGREADSRDVPEIQETQEPSGESEGKHTCNCKRSLSNWQHYQNVRGNNSSTIGRGR